MSKTSGWGHNNNNSASAATVASAPLADLHHHHHGGGGAEDQATLARTLLVTISGNRATWNHMQMHGAVWQVNPDHAASIFADSSSPASAGAATTSSSMMMMVVEQTHGGGAEHNGNAAMTDRLSRAMIRKVTLMESNTNIDEPVAVHIDGLPSREFTRNGEGASIFLTGEGRVTQQQEIFSLSGNTALGLQWMRQFPRYTSENLETEGVMFLTGASYYFVHQEHPVIHFLKANEEQLGILCFQEPSLEGGWIRVDVDAFVFTVRNIRETVLRNTPSTFNLNTLTVRLTKPDAQPWLHLSPQFINSLLPDEVRESNNPDLINEARQLGIQRYLDRPLFATLRLRIEYALPDAAPPPSILAPSSFPGGGATLGINGTNNNNGGGGLGGNPNNNNNNSNAAIALTAGNCGMMGPNSAVNNNNNSMGMANNNNGQGGGGVRKL